MGTKSHYEEFQTLSFEDQCKVVYETSMKKKADLIIRSHEPTRLVNSLTPEELYLVVREMDSSNVPELIQYANISQLEFIADFECWDNDYISVEGFIQWLSYLEEASDERLVAWLLKTEFDMIIAGFQKCMTVLKPDHEEAVDEEIGDQPYFTIDGLYYILIDEDNMKPIERAVRVLFEYSKEHYYNLLERVLSEVSDIVEEEALQHRFVRLTEKGFPKKEYAQRIYRHVTQDEWDRYSFRDKKERVSPDAALGLPHYPTLWDKEKLFFDDVMATIGDLPFEINKEIYQELIWLANKIIICKGIKNFSEEELTQCFQHLRHIMSIGLEELSGREVNKAKTYLAERWLEYIFRWGMTQLLKQRDQLEDCIRTYWPDSVERLCEFFDEPYSSIVRGMIAVCPKRYDPFIVDSFDKLRDFKNLAEVADIEEKIQKIKAMFLLLHSPLGEGWDAYLTKEDSLTENQYQDVPFSTFIFTYFVQFVLGKKLAVKPLKIVELSTFLEKAFLGIQTLSEARSLDPHTKATFVQSFYQTSHLPEDVFNRLHESIEYALQKGEDELRLLSSHQKINPAYIQCVLLQ